MGMASSPSDGEWGLQDLAKLLVQIIDLRDPSAERHANGVSTLNAGLGRRIQLDSHDLEILEISGLLHDVGKVAISESVIHKPTRLTRAEFSMVQQHTVLGYRLLEPLRIDRMLTTAILSHHENFDGSGYPEGLKGDAIPLAARVIRITDYYDALTTYRSYRVKSMYTAAEALDVLQENRPCFDPSLLDEFVELMADSV